MFKVFQHYGNIQEVVIPDKRNKLGRRFRFALFAHVYDEDRFGVELDNIIIIIGRGKIFVILPRFRRGRRGHRSTEVKNHKDHEEDNMKQGLNNKHQAKTDMDQRTFAKAVQNNNNDKKEDDCRKVLTTRKMGFSFGLGNGLKDIASKPNEYQKENRPKSSKS
ncbi:hypothetical protein L195_g038277 [Trifolium pratense]|uniref:RRM domain-containing protein n=1 Tax=Trifolium pratense TaxID=57577 RepID=A0A2K3LUN2_TRIPR|nr:hypothetical protein L195_g038277 [Trifolium pratense]